MWARAGNIPAARRVDPTVAPARLALVAVLAVAGCGQRAAPPTTVVGYVYVYLPVPQSVAYVAPPAPAPSLVTPAAPIVASAPPGVLVEERGTGTAQADALSAAAPVTAAPVASGAPWVESADPRWSTHRAAAPPSYEPAPAPAPAVVVYETPPPMFVAQPWPGPYYARRGWGRVAIGIGVGFGGGWHHGGGRGGRGGWRR
jgi:hypothetical protein